MTHAPLTHPAAITPVDPRLLQTLRCPFCGGPVSPGDNPAILGCLCNAYPVVAGVPVMSFDARADEALKAVHAGDHAAALRVMLGDTAAGLAELPASATFADALEVAGAGAEGHYFLYRFSDPVYLTSRALLLAASNAQRPRYALDICGGAGHLTRVLSRECHAEHPVLADLFFWKLYLARRFLSTGAMLVCCDANKPLPFAPESFDVVLCSGAFEYIWHRRSFANEMLRLITAGGSLLVTHLRNINCHTHNAGMPVDPRTYRAMFESPGFRVALHDEAALLADVVAGRSRDLATGSDDDALAETPLLAAVATRRPDGLPADLRLDPPQALRPVLNPLYRPSGRPHEYVVTFPTPEYADEFGATAPYLAERVTLTAAQEAALAAHRWDACLADLACRLVVLDLPADYGTADLHTPGEQP